jgi:hypothetical protein
VVAARFAPVHIGRLALLGEDGERVAHGAGAKRELAQTAAGGRGGDRLLGPVFGLCLRRARDVLERGVQLEPRALPDGVIEQPRRQRDATLAWPG